MGQFLPAPSGSRAPGSQAGSGCIRIRLPLACKGCPGRTTSAGAHSFGLQRQAAAWQVHVFCHSPTAIRPSGPIGNGAERVEFLQLVRWLKRTFSAQSALSASDADRSMRFLNWEAFTSGAMFSLGSGGLLAAYALALGASALQVGVLAAIPPASQVVRLPAILAIRRFRSRKRPGLPAVALTQLAWIPIGAVPFVLEVPGSGAVLAVIALLALRGLAGPVWVTASTSWVRDLAPPNQLAGCFGRRQAMATLGAALAALVGSLMVEWWLRQAAPDQQVFGYSILLIGGVAVLGVWSPILAMRALEPLQQADRGSGLDELRALAAPIRDRNCAHLLRFLLAWNLGANLAIPFFVVFMLTELAMTLPVVVALTVVGQANSVLFAGVWGRLADRAGNKTVLSLAASLQLLVIAGWVFVSPPAQNPFNYALLVLLNGFGGIALAGTMLTMNTLALKIAPEGDAITYSGIAGIAASLGAGIGPVLGGLLVDGFAGQSLRLQLIWSSPNESATIPGFELAGFDFVFVIAFLVAMLSLNLLLGLREEGESTRDAALGELLAGIDPLMGAVNRLPGIGLVSSISQPYLRRVPGADVALGVTAYQVAAATRAATASAWRGQTLARGLSKRIEAVLEQVSQEVGGAAGGGAVLARNAARGALLAAGQLGQGAGSVTDAALGGVVHALGGADIDPEVLLQAAAFGAVEGAIESGSDARETGRAVLSAAGDLAADLGINEDRAVAAAKAGITAARAASPLATPIRPDDERNDS